MALEFKELVKLTKQVACADASAPVAYSFNNETFSYSDLDNALRAELNELAGTYSLFRDNKNKVFALMEQTIDEIFPKKVLEQYSSFAEIKFFN